MISSRVGAVTVDGRLIFDEFDTHPELAIALFAKKYQDWDLLDIHARKMPGHLDAFGVEDVRNEVEGFLMHMHGEFIREKAMGKKKVSRSLAVGKTSICRIPIVSIRRGEKMRHYSPGPSSFARCQELCGQLASDGWWLEVDFYNDEIWLREKKDNANN